MPSNAFGLQIEETTGQKRRVTLHGRALPYRGSSIGWEGRQRHNLTWYPGNPQGTLQVLGPEEEPSSFEGTWKSRFLPNQVELEGFPGIQKESITAEQLIFLFDSIRVAGNALRVQWGPFVRNGILSRFRSEPDRIEDIRWQVTFTWFAREDQAAPRASAEPQERPNLRQRLNEMDDNLAFSPPDVIPDFRAQTVSAIAGFRRQAGVIFDRVRAVDGLVRTPLSALGAVASAAESIRAEAEDEIGRLAETPYDAVSVVSRVADVLKGEGWRRTQARRAHRFRAESQRQEITLRKKARPGALAVVVVPGDTSLRQLSLDAYGTADSWQLIADFNGLVGSVVPAGTTIVIPPPQAQQQGAARGDLSS